MKIYLNDAADEEYGDDIDILTHTYLLNSSVFDLFMWGFVYLFEYSL